MSESSGSKPIIIQPDGAFNAGITLTESNYDVWSQLMEMHIAEREKLSYIRGKKPPPKESDEGVISAYPLLAKSRVLYPKLSMMEAMSYLSSPCTREPLLLNKMEGHSLSIMEN
ncbi:hypothetical protein Patl1_33681 [Pistacia atlantica]|uniref:Uncharacterized protein n=1 Tax=Pistacia atlantica TaxID=434234 RepID=A0ACC0ZWR0_9ROSI|nr:hypothetical protein Patl1_33681 [Pistacia atlantica]